MCAGIRGAFFLIQRANIKAKLTKSRFPQHLQVFLMCSASYTQIQNQLLWNKRPNDLHLFIS